MFFIHVSNGFDYRYDQSQKTIIINQAEAFKVRAKEYLIDYANINATDKFGNARYVDDYRKSFVCTLDKGHQTKETINKCLNHHLDGSGYLLFGDSHSGDFYNVLKVSYPDINIATLTQSGCIPTNHALCFNDVSIRELINEFLQRKMIKGVIFSSLFKSGEDVDINQFKKDIIEYSNNISVYVVNVGPINDGLADDYNSIDGGIYNLSNIKNLRNIEINASLSDLSKIDNVYVIDKYNEFCDGVRCKLLDGLIPLFADEHHLSPAGYKYWAEKLKGNINFN